jgi:catechol 2,3-dioxygenase-like lactoylglutathione lyase family enzyme
MMNFIPKSIRPFIGTKDYNVSRNFYAELGFEELKLSVNMSYFKLGEYGFYLQDAYVKDWIDSSMVFLEVENLKKHFSEMKELKLDKKYARVRITEIVYNDWGNEFFLYDPSGVLWRIGEFK